MQVNLDLSKKTQPQFTAIKYKDAKAVGSYLFKNLSSKDNTKFRYIQIASENAPIDMYLSVVKNRFGKDKLLVEVGNKQFKEGFFKSAIRAIKDGFYYSEKFYKEQ